MHFVYSSLKINESCPIASALQRVAMRSGPEKGCPNSLSITVVLLSFLAVLGDDVALCRTAETMISYYVYVGEKRLTSIVPKQRIIF